MSYKTLIVLNILVTVAFVGVVSALAQSADVTPPAISGVNATAIRQTGATINWTTDELADSQVEYGTTTAYGLLSSLDTATTTAHHVALSSLTASTTYHYLVKSKDTTGNLATSTDNTFTTLADTTAPVISAVTVSGIANTSATINWTTDELADSQVEYGTTTAYGLMSPLITTATTAHHIALSSLTASSTHHFIVKSKDAAGNLATSTDYSFTTVAAPVVSNSTVKVSIEPRVLNTASRGNWIEAEVTFPRGTDIRALDLTSIRLNNAIAPIRVKTSKQKWYELFSRKAPKAEMKFSRAEVVDLLLSGTTASSTAATSTSPVIAVEQRDLTISGTVGGTVFAGSTKIYLVIRNSAVPPIIFPHKEEKHGKEEEHENKEAKKEKESRFEYFVTASSTATTSQVLGRERDDNSFSQHQGEKKGWQKKGKERKDH